MKSIKNYMIKISKSLSQNKQQNKPIDKNLIKNSKYYIPYFTNEKDWHKISLNINWFNILSYNYKIDTITNNSTGVSHYSKSKICSIDIGCKNFITLYGLDGYCYKIKSNYLVIDKILQNKKISYKEKDRRIQQLINELHSLSAQFICQQYDIIYVGLVNNKGNINSQFMKSIEDNLLKIVSHKEFLDLLQYYANIYNKTIKIVEESYTSIQCGVCGEKNKFTRIFDNDDSERRKYSCKFCNSEFCRDLNASRNILIKNEHLV